MLLLIRLSEWLLSCLGRPVSRVSSVAVGACAAGFAALALGSPAWAASHAASPAASACASLGDAAGFAVFSDGDFDASAAPGTTITGRVAAAGDVTLDGVSVGLAAGESAPEVLAGGSFSGGMVTGAGGEVNGGVSYGVGISVAANFQINGPVGHEAPPFSFADAFESLRQLSSSLAELDQSAGASVELNKYSGALVLTGTDEGLNVFTVSAAQLTQSQGIVIDLTKAGATALINVGTDTDLAVGPQYMSLSGAATAAGIVWNLPLATGFDFTRGVGWQGLILAPNAAVSGEGRPQLTGELIAASVPGGDWVVSGLASDVCLPAPDTSMSLSALCVNAAGELAMRLRNTSARSRRVEWVDVSGGDFGAFEVPAGSDMYFHVAGGSAGSVIRATSEGVRVSANGTSKRCAGTITVQLVTVGPVPDASTRWDVLLEGVNYAHTLTLGPGDSETVPVPGDYLEGSAAVDQVIGGEAYVVTVPEAHGGQVTVSLDPVQVLDGESEIVIVTVTYPTPPTEPPPIVVPPPTEPPPTTEPPTGPPTEPPPTTPGAPEPPQAIVPPVEQPTLPPGAPAPPEGPPLSAGSSGADLAVTHRITPRRLLAGNTVETVTRVRNLGGAPAVGAVVRELPQYNSANPNGVARVLSLTTTKGTCTQRRPIRCALGTLVPGAQVTIRTRTRILVAAALHSIVVVSSQTKETNTANNMAIAAVTTHLPAPHIQAHITAPALVHVATPVQYRVSVTGAARTVRLCSTPPRGLIDVHGHGLSVYRGRFCIDVPSLPRGRTFGFTLTGIAATLGRLPLSARATAAGLARPAKASTNVSVIGPTATCTAQTHHTRQPTGHAAC